MSSSSNSAAAAGRGEAIYTGGTQATIYDDNYEEMRQIKQSYLIEHVANCGFDTTEFA